MNRKGFSLIELIASIAIIGLLASVALISYNGFIKKSEDRVYETYMDSMHEGVVMLFSRDPSLIPTTSRRIDLSLLNIENIKNPRDSQDECLNSYVDVTRSNISGVINITYNVCLVCNSYNNCKEYIN